jgi:GT2 family glycosyltransferase
MTGEMADGLSQPLVTILIATKDRPDDLRRTLRELRRQVYPAIEMIVIDDGSAEKLQPIVEREWPQATFIRCAESAGQCKRRSEGFQIAKGEYILQLDDDSHPVAPTALAQSVAAMQTNASWGALAFYVFNGADLPAELPVLKPKYFWSFVGCGVLFRTRALRQVGGYREFFGNEWEEEELGLRILAAGWVIYFFPAVVIHHHVSVRNRNQERTWSRNIRNKLWAMVMNMRAGRLPFEMGWIVLVGFLDAVRMWRFKSYAQAIFQFAGGLPRAVRLRQPMPAMAVRRYNATRFQTIETESDYLSPPKWNWGVMWRWFTTSWMNRARERSFWDNRRGDVGRSGTVGYAHEYISETRDDRKS